MSADRHRYNYVESNRCPSILNMCSITLRRGRKKTDQEETSDTLCFSAEHVRLRILKVSAAGKLDRIKTGSEGY